MRFTNFVVAVVAFDVIVLTARRNIYHKVHSGRTRTSDNLSEGYVGCRQPDVNGRWAMVEMETERIVSSRLLAPPMFRFAAERPCFTRKNRTREARIMKRLNTVLQILRCPSQLYFIVDTGNVFLKIAN